MTRQLRRGDYVRVRLADTDHDWTEGFVEMASETNPSSVMLQVEGIQSRKGAIIIGGLPLTIDYKAETVESLFGDSYEIEVAESI